MASDTANNSTQETNKQLVQASFDRWGRGEGSPFDLLVPDAEWIIVGSSPLSKTYHSKQEFIDQVRIPFNARMAKPLFPTVHGIYADGDMVIVLFDLDAVGHDGIPYHNNYTWYLQMKDGLVCKVIAFFDTQKFDEFWARVSPNL
jgi:uncharacterized protein